MLHHLQETILSKAFSCLVIKGDCRDIAFALPAESIDLTIMDPAYESLERHRAKGTTTRLKESDKSSNKWFQTLPNTAYWGLLAQLHVAHKDDTHCYIFCDSETEHVILSGRNPYDDASDTALLNHQIELTARPSKCPHCQEWGTVRPIDTDPDWRVWPPLTWVKTKIGCAPVEPEQLEGGSIRAGLGYHWRRAEERILFLEKGKRKLNNLGWPSVLCGERAGKGYFPTEKPLSVLRKLIQNSSQPGDIVLDLFAGSGATGRAALACGRRAILVDIDISWMQKHPVGLLEYAEGQTPYRMEVIE